MTDEEMISKLEAILLEDEEQQMNFPFQAMGCPVERLGNMECISDNIIQIGIGVTIILIIIVMGIMYIQRKG